jgi:hypothetical protein
MSTHTVLDLGNLGHVSSSILEASKVALAAHDGVLAQEVEHPTGQLLRRSTFMSWKSCRREWGLLLPQGEGHGAHDGAEQRQLRHEQPEADSYISNLSSVASPAHLP